MANEQGVWRTIAGRKIFIVEGQDLETAIKNSVLASLEILLDYTMIYSLAQNEIILKLFRLKEAEKRKLSKQNI